MLTIQEVNDLRQTRDNLRQAGQLLDQALRLRVNDVQEPRCKMIEARAAISDALSVLPTYHDLDRADVDSRRVA